MSQHHGRRNIEQSKRRHRHWRCYHCGQFGHIKSFSYKLHGYPKSDSQLKINPITHTERRKKQWVPRASFNSLIAHTSLRASAQEDWYFDSGCSRHMTGVKNLLVDITTHSTSFVIF